MTRLHKKISNSLFRMKKMIKLIKISMMLLAISTNWLTVKIST